MTHLALKARRLAAAAALAVAGGSAGSASAQFVAVNNYQPAPAAATTPTQQPPAYVTPPGVAQYAPAAQYGPAAQYAPAPTGAPPAFMTGATPQAPAYRVAQTLSEPNAAVEALPAPAATAAPMVAAPMVNGSYAPASAAPMMHQHSHATPHSAYSGASAPAATGCATGDCNQGVAWGGYMNTGAGCETTAPCDYAPTCEPCATPACNVAPPRPRRQWFAGVYGLFLQRADTDKRLVAFCDDIGGYTPGTPYYYEPGDTAIFTDGGGIDGQWGAEVRFGATFGCADACGCGQPFAWEVGYWGLNDDSSQQIVPLIGTVGASGATNHGLFGTIDYTGIRLDADGAGLDWGDRDLNEYTQYGVHETGDMDTTNTRLLGVRVRNNFQIQNLEFNFWRFGCPIEVGGLGIGGGRAGGACGVGAGACGADACAPAACRPPRRFFINGLAGVRFLRVDDSLGLAYQWTQLDAGTGDPPTGWPTEYESFPSDDNSVFFHDVDVDNQLVGFQLGSSMNWLVGCKWNFFADSNFGVYGNQIDVTQRLYGGGASEVTRRADGGSAVYRSSTTDVAFLGELRTGVGYQLSCNCRLTAAYRLIGIGGLGLGFNQIPTAGFANPDLVQHVSNNSSVLLHGVQTGVEWKY